MRYSKALVRLLAAMGAAFGVACQHADAPAGASVALKRDGSRLIVDAASPLRKALEVAAVETRDVATPVSVPGVVEADPARLVRIAPPVSGRITRLVKRLGDAVAAGDVLFVLDSPELAQAISDAAKADAALALARRTVRREGELLDAEIAARKDLEQAQNDFELADSEARRAHARLAQLDVRAGGSGRDYTMRAPIAGRVIELSAAEGGFWNDTSAPLMTIADLSSVWVAASVPEKDLAAVAVGEDAVIELNAYPGAPVRGKVAYVGDVLDADTRTVKARIAAANPDGRLRPGLFARVVLRDKAHAAAMVPAAALVQSGFDTQVYVEQSPGVYEARKVVPGARVEGAVEIVSGLAAGERVVVKNGVLLDD